MNVYSLFMYFSELDFLGTDTKYTFLEIIKICDVTVYSDF